MISSIDLIEFSFRLVVFSFAVAMTMTWLLSRDKPTDYPLEDDSESESESDDDLSEETD